MDELQELPTVVKRSASVPIPSGVWAGLKAVSDGDTQTFCRAKILHTMKLLSWGLDAGSLDISSVVDEICVSVGGRISAHQLQEFASSALSARSIRHPDYSRLAGRMLVANLHKTIHKSFVSWVHMNNVRLSIDPAVVAAVTVYPMQIDAALMHHRDFDYNYISVKTLSHRCLAKDEEEILERPQFMHMRIAITIHGTDLDRVLETYDALSRGLYTHATPVLYNGGTSKRNFASCFLYQPDATSHQTLLRSVSDLERLWIGEGGVGMSLATVSPSRGSGPRPSPGVLSLMRIYDAHASFVASTGLRRPSAATVYLPIWHEEVLAFIQCRTSRTPPIQRVFHLYPALWIPDIFMQRLKDDRMWTLFNPADTPDLVDLVGDEFSASYVEYESSGTVTGTKIPASVLFSLVCHSQRESGAPFLLYQDSINLKNNQSHLGIIRSSNLCTEIVQYSSSISPAVCTLASIALTRFVTVDGSFDLRTFHATAGLVVRNLDILIERAHYPTSAARDSVMKTRSLGVGVQGLADVFRMMKISFDSATARSLNMQIFETLYHACLDASCSNAEEKGSYPAWQGSPAQRGVLQMDMWPGTSTSLHDFNALKQRILVHGLRNSMLTAQMPTASTAHVLGNSESTDPRMSNVTTYRIGSGEYTEVCPYLVRELVGRGFWTESTRISIVERHGSVAHMTALPDAIREIFKTSWEIDPKIVIDLAADRGPFIDQSQSMSLSVAWPEVEQLRQLQLYGWERGLKTGMYYLRCRPPTFPLPYGVPRLQPVVPSDDEDSEYDSPPPLEPAESRSTHSFSAEGPRSPSPAGAGPQAVHGSESPLVTTDDDADDSSKATKHMSGLEPDGGSVGSVSLCSACVADAELNRIDSEDEPAIGVFVDSADSTALHVDDPVDRRWSKMTKLNLELQPVEFGRRQLEQLREILVTGVATPYRADDRSDGTTYRESRKTSMSGSSGEARSETADKLSVDRGTPRLMDPIPNPPSIDTPAPAPTPAWFACVRPTQGTSELPHAVSCGFAAPDAGVSLFVGAVSQGGICDGCEA